MCRFLAAAVVTALIIPPTAAFSQQSSQMALTPTNNNALEVRCSEFVAAYRTERYFAFQEEMERLPELAGPEPLYPTPCAMSETVRAACVKRPNDPLIATINDLSDRKRRGLPVPSGRRCGA